MNGSIDPLGVGLTPRLVEAALDGALSRHAAIATNIANAETDGFRPMQSRFDSLFEQVRATVGDRSRDAETLRAVERVREDLAGEAMTVDAGSDRVELDMQMAALARNTLRYEALLTAQGKLGQMMQLVIGEGKM
jgi:flagellar basal-body rod protein FlgB